MQAACSQLPHPDIEVPLNRLIRVSRDLLAPLTALVATRLPLGSTTTSILARVIFR